LSCGWLPPSGPIELGCRFVGGWSVPYGKIVAPVELAYALFAGGFPVARFPVPSSVCEWLGICWIVSVTVSTPPVSAIVKPLPWWSGIRPRRSGSANVLCPSPP
jgi:hypothetical protein